MELIRYSLHEFGTSDVSHAFTYWPGFTLNPAVWDLSVLRSLMNGGEFFNSSETRFEQAFSLAAHRAGVRVAYLPHMTFRHIGVDVSAYQLMNATRPWDATSTGA